MIRNRSGSPKPPELKLEGQQRAGTSCGSPCQHILLEAGLSPMSAKGEVQLEALSRFLPALLVCNLAQHLNFPGRKCKIQHQHVRCPVTELTRTFPHCCCCLVTQSCLTFWDPMDCSLPGSSVHGFSQASVLEWAAIHFSRVSSRLKDWTSVSCTAGGFFTTELPGKPTFCHTCLQNPLQRKLQLCSQASHFFFHTPAHLDLVNNKFCYTGVWNKYPLYFFFLKHRLLRKS